LAISTKEEPPAMEQIFFNCNVKCDSVDNNMAEIFNGFILEVKNYATTFFLRVGGYEYNFITKSKP